MLNRGCWLRATTGSRLSLNAHKAEVAGDCVLDARQSILGDAILVAALIPHANGNSYCAVAHGAIDSSKGSRAGNSLALPSMLPAKFSKDK